MANIITRNIEKLQEIDNQLGGFLRQLIAFGFDSKDIKLLVRQKLDEIENADKAPANNSIIEGVAIAYECACPMNCKMHPKNPQEPFIRRGDTVICKDCLWDCPNHSPNCKHNKDCTCKQIGTTKDNDSNMHISHIFATKGCPLHETRGETRKLTIPTTETLASKETDFKV